MLVHFTVNPYDSNLDYSEICKSLFGPSRCLAMLEHTKKGKVGPHVHIQGETELSQRTVDDKISELITKVHYKRKMDGNENARVCKRVKRDVTEEGFQYMCKDDKSTILFSQGFTDADFLELADKSELHNQKIKHGADEYVWKYLELTKETEFVDILVIAKRLYLKYLRGEKKGWPTSAQIRSKVYRIVYDWPKASKALKLHCMDTI